MCPTLLAAWLTTVSLDIIVQNILPWCTAIAGYRASNDYSNSQQQSTRGYNKQANATMHYSTNKSENHHKYNICVGIQVC